MGIRSEKGWQCDVLALKHVQLSNTPPLPIQGSTPESPKFENLYINLFRKLHGVRKIP
jgi:hypothetical protein